MWKVHPSVKPNKEFQRMEFFGDKIISFILTKILIEQNNEDSEGEKIDEAQLSLNISNMVSKLTMSELGTFLIEDIESHEQINDKVSADCLEAFIGCVYKDGGDVESIIKSIWKDLINHKFEKNAKNQLQEWTQMKGYSPIYIFKKEENGEFSCELNIQGRKCITTASSKQVASIKCAELMMIKLAEKTDSEGKSRFRRSDEFQEEATDRRPRQEGGFSRRSEGGFDRRPRESSAGGFSRRSEGSFDRRPREGSTGGFSRRSEGGSFDRRPREGSAGGFSRRSEGGSFDRRPREGSAGGFRRSEGSFGKDQEKDPQEVLEEVKEALADQEKALQAVLEDQKVVILIEDQEKALQAVLEEVKEALADQEKALQAVLEEVKVVVLIEDQALQEVLEEVKVVLIEDQEKALQAVLEEVKVVLIEDQEKAPQEVLADALKVVSVEGIDLEKRAFLNHLEKALIKNLPMERILTKRQKNEESNLYCSRSTKLW